MAGGRNHSASERAPSLSVVIPVFNEPVWIRRAVADLEEAVRRSPFEDVRLIIVDDGSDPPTQEALATLETGLDLTVVRQANAGRFAARRAGVAAASGQLVLLIDSRVSLGPDALAFVAERLAADPSAVIWNAHVDVDVDGNLYARFWNVLTEIAFREYFDDPRTTSYGLEEFDRFPKGTTCFLAPRDELMGAIEAFSSHYEDVRDANDDTVMIRHLAARRRINISPGFSCLYRGRGALLPFLRHSHHRGVVFVDGFLRRGTRFLVPLLLFFPVSALAVAVAAARPRAALRAVPVAPLACAAVAAVHRRRPADTAALALLGPVWALVYGAGVWRGAAAALRARVRR
ncbi:glycosyltransferase family 2 protein [Miltoncostaea marina]|uniref:glycosyltransferase family 2 protein n=1 Tax=Miltoncostaea marina TaxID=2843215 RepID=UPI001C3CBAF5|nr:glycosyltransferase [Miltoncostaea marina]